MTSFAPSYYVISHHTNRKHEESPYIEQVLTHAREMLNAPGGNVSIQDGTGARVMVNNNDVKDLDTFQRAISSLKPLNPKRRIKNKIGNAYEISKEDGYYDIQILRYYGKTGDERDALENYSPDERIGSFMRRNKAWDTIQHGEDYFWWVDHSQPTTIPNSLRPTDYIMEGVVSPQEAAKSVIDNYENKTKNGTW